MRNTILLQRKQLITANKHLVAGLERSCDNSLLGLDGEVHLVDRTQNLVDLADGRLISID